MPAADSVPKLYTHPFSHGRISRWLLEEIGTPYEVEIIDIDADTRPPHFLALNPMGKVPVLTLGEAVITEAAAITAFLADAFPEAGLAPPPGSPERGAFYRWLFFAAGPFDTATTLETMDFVPPPFAEYRAPWGTLDRILDTLEATLQAQPFLTGQFSAADIHLGSLLEWAMRFDVVSPRPVFEDWTGRLFDRPAARRAEAADEALFPTGRATAERGPGPRLTVIPGGR